MAHVDTVIAWLNDAHALENNLVQVLENHANDAKDYPQIQANVLFIATLLVLSNLVVDMIYAWIDPRIRYA